MKEPSLQESSEETPAPKAPPIEPAKTEVQEWCDRYGDLIFDLCESILWSRSNAQLAFRLVLKELKNSRKNNRYVEFEKPWVLRVTCEKLKSYSVKHGRRLSPSEQIMLDATLDFESKIRQFDSYFHRLSTDDQLLLLLKDKFRLPDDEISAALGLPLGSIKILRQQAYERLEDWIWDQAQ